ncbi:siderophore-interacting protein [Flavobacterium sp. IR1]|nr:siderophore-interacting protein [Flavobacterium sp. IR1]
MPKAPKWLLDTVDKLFLPKLPKMEVIDTVDLSQGVKKIRFKGDFTKFAFKPGSHMDIRVSDTEIRRYTAAYSDTKAGIMDFVVHLHGRYPGSDYMRGLEKGHKINISILKNQKYYYPSVSKYVFFGDETALALACSLLTVLEKNGHEFQFYFELDKENAAVPELLNFKNYTVFSKNGFFQNPEWLADMPVLQTGNWNNASFILAGNTKSVQAIRKMLKGKIFGKLTAHGYWLEGKEGL